MNFFKEEKLFRVEIIKKCYVINLAQYMFSKGYLPSFESFEDGSFGFIPAGIKGWVIKKYNKKYFLPDGGQSGLDLFISTDQNNVLISFDKIENAYKLI